MSPYRTVTGQSGFATILALAVIAAAVVPSAAAVGTGAADEAALTRLGEGYGSASFRHHFYRNVPNKGLSREDHEMFLDAKDAAEIDARLPL